MISKKHKRDEVRQAFNDGRNISREAEIEQRERLLQLTIENANLCDWKYDFIDNRLSTENKVLKNAGYIENPENLPESQIADGFIAEESIEDYRKLFKDLRAGNSTARADIWFCRNRDEADKRCLSLCYTVHKDEKGEVQFATGLGIDVTEKKQTELLYQKRVDLLFHSYPRALGSLTMNLSRDMVYKQKRMYDYIEEHEDTSISEYLDELKEQIPANDFKKYVKCFSKESLVGAFNEGKQQVALTHRYGFLDRMRWITTTAQILKNPLMDELEAYIFAVDVTDEMQSKLVLQKLIDYRYDIIALIYTKENRVDFRYAGNEFEVMPEISIEDYEANRIQAANLFSKEQALEYIENTEMSHITEQLDKNGKYFFNMVLDVEGKGRYKRYSYNYLTRDKEVILSTVQDTTQVIEKEQEQINIINEALKEAELANVAKSEFLSRMSHDIRTPMNAIINMAKFARDDILNKDENAALEDLDKLESTSQFLLGLINDILDVSRIDSGKMELQPSLYSYDEFANYIESMIIPLCEQKHISFTWNKASIYKSLYIDKTRFNQMIFNLLSNAVKFTPEYGRVSLLESDVEITEDGITETFSIIDTGIGMSEEIQKSMFEPFSRDKGVNEIQGTGLGLAIVRKIVELMDGTIMVKSELGKGSTFSVRLRMPFATNKQLEEYRKNVNKLSGELDSLSGKTILVAEDHELNMAIITRLLERKGMTVIKTINGVEVVEAFKKSEENSIDAILMDVRMPHKDGLGATKEIREILRPDAKKIPIIAMTANAFEEDRKLSREAGMTGFITKPIEPQLLYSTLEKHI